MHAYTVTNLVEWAVGKGMPVLKVATSVIVWPAPFPVSAVLVGVGTTSYTVVLATTVSVMTEVVCWRAGQSVTVAGHAVTVTVRVVRIVSVVYWRLLPVDCDGSTGDPVMVEPGAAPVVVASTGHTVVET